MKIKELHLRNIASIEQADIDFEHDLITPSTGEQASIFLISGDTGVGKTVLLDAISMALYKTTPRIEKVSNPKENSFEDSHGVEIGVNSLSQYTRLGISPSDDCYSEVRFEGNDGIDYRARVELGITRNHTYREIKWTVKVGDADWIRVTTRENPIQQAIGLSFQQFNRMVMLAQGQFSSFLCGDKKEREEILEQLTNTELFSTYGSAIKSLFDRAKKAASTTKSVWQTELSHILPKTVVDTLTHQLDENAKIVAALKQKTTHLEEQLSQVSLITDNVNKAQSAKQRIADVEALRAGERYLTSRQLIADWSATEKERQQLIQLREATEGKTKLSQQLKQYQERFSILSSDLNWRKEQILQKTRQLSDQDHWLQERADRSQLYTQADETNLLLSNYATHSNNRQQLANELKSSTDQRIILEERLSQATQQSALAEKAVRSKEKEIATIQQQREQLKPEEINRQLTFLANQRKQIEYWQTQTKQITELQQTLSTKSQKAVRLQESLNSQQHTLKIAEENALSAQKRYDEANQRCSIMSTSVKEGLVELRAQLSEVHADTCPLCGQHMAHIPVNIEFDKILEPLRKERAERMDEYNKAKTHKDDTQRECANIIGQVKTLNSDIADMRQTLQRTEEALQSEIEREGLSYDESFADQIDKALEENSNRQHSYEEKQRQLETLQQQWQQLLREKKPLDSTYTNTQKELANASNALKNTTENIQKLNQQLSTASDELTKLYNTLTARLSPFYPKWDGQLPTTRQRLKDDAAEYQLKQTKRDKFALNLEKEGELCQQITNTQTALLNSHPEWNLTYLPQQHISQQILSDWSLLSSSINELQGKMATFNDTIQLNSQSLNEWYSRTQHEESYLIWLISQKLQLDAAQQYVKRIDEDFRSASDALKVASKDIAAGRNSMGLRADGPLPDLEVLRGQKTALDSQREEAATLQISAQKQLETNTDNQKRLIDAQKQMDEAEQHLKRWEKINRHFGGTRFRTLVQTFILRPLLNNANIYLSQITDRYLLTCNEENDKLSILVLDRYNKNEIRSVTVLSGGERFMISLALSLALSSLNRPDFNVNILFIDEGFGTLDEKNLDTVMSTLEKLQDIAGQNSRRVAIISHREELLERIRTQIRICRHGESRSRVEIINE